MPIRKELMFFNKEITIELSSDFEQLDWLWNKNVEYNWYNVTLLHFSIEKSKIDDIENLEPFNMCDINLGLLGFSVYISISEKMK